ncbi:MAG: hypothetical protein LLG42_12705 [Chloroflexi bacterium]|nr:hypothetical protein [Chloroflexota bacterium]
MSTFRYQLNGNWYKGNTHLHSTVSDGLKPYQELAHLYRQSGYDFLYLTDHWEVSHILPDRTDEGLLWFNGIELNGPDSRGQEFHIVCLGNFQGIDNSLTLEQAVKRATDQNGFIILAHPFWTGNSLEDTQKFSFDACEVFNYICQCEIGKGDGLIHYSYMLERNPNLLGIASDDSHFSSDSPMWKGGWVMVNAKERSHAAIQAALRTGNFYSSSGPEFYNISCQGKRVRVETSPVQFVKLVGPAWHGHGKAKGMLEDAKPITSAEFEISPDWAYAYIEIQDMQNRRAWTNNLFVP